MTAERKDPTNGKSEHAAIPYKITEYLRQHFGSEILTDIKRLTSGNAAWYLVDVSHDNTLYHLKFNSDGVLVSRETEPLMELYDEDGLEDIE